MRRLSPHLRGRKLWTRRVEVHWCRLLAIGGWRCWSGHGGSSDDLCSSSLAFVFEPPTESSTDTADVKPPVADPRHSQVVTWSNLQSLCMCVCVLTMALSWWCYCSCCCIVAAVHASALYDCLDMCPLVVFNVFVALASRLCCCVRVVVGCCCAMALTRTSTVRAHLPSGQVGTMFR